MSAVVPMHPEDDRPDPLVNEEAEQALLGIVLARNRTYETVAETLRAEHFVDPSHALIFEACGTLIDRGEEANAVTLGSYVNALGILKTVGGHKYLAELQGSFVSTLGLRDYAGIITDLWARRQAVEAANDILDSAYDVNPESDAGAVLSVAEERFGGIAEGLSDRAGEGPVPMSEGISRAIETAERLQRGESDVLVVPTGLVDLDALVGGLRAGDLAILAGRPSMGKSGLGFGVALNMARASRPVMYASLEMTKDQLGHRALAQLTGYSVSQIRNGAQELDIDRLCEADREMRSWPLYIDDQSAVTVQQIRAHARRLKRRSGLELLVVDYLQIVQGRSGRVDRRYDDVTDISAELKRTAKDLQVPVLALSQLSRALEQREDRRPRLSDLRESGAIEQDADMVWFLYREEYYAKFEEPQRRTGESRDSLEGRRAGWQERMDACRNIAELSIAKYRQGETGMVKLHFDGPTTAFRDLARPNQEEMAF